MSVEQAAMPLPAESPRRRSASERYALIAFGLAIFLIVALAGLANRALEQSETMNRWVRHTYEVLDTLDSAMVELSTVHRRDGLSHHGRERGSGTAGQR